MFSIMLLIAAFQTGDITMILLVMGALGWLWYMIISEFQKGARAASTKQSRQYQSKPKQNPIDKHGDEVYGTIDWLRNGKL